MNADRLCYGCFREKSGPVCPYCGYDPARAEQPVLALPAGTILAGRYLTGKVLGMGGFGVTYLGYDLTLAIKVAIKEYLPSGMAARGTDRYTLQVISSREEGAYRSGEERFLDEARILAKLQHVPNIVSVQNYFRENNTAYFVMDYIDGMSLKAYVESQGGKIPFTQALAILSPIMEALAQVHEQGLLHRDIAPDNIYITSNGESRLLDFGASRFALGDERSLSVILKHGYAPEEQYRTHGNQGPWTDVYAMGATLYQCITGVLPPDSIDRRHEDSLLPPQALGVSMPSGAEAALLQALRVKPEQRFGNMGAFLFGLHGGGGGNAAQSIKTSLGTKTAYIPPAAAESMPKPGAGFFARLKTDRRLALFTCGGAALAVLLVVLLVLLPKEKSKSVQAEVSGGTAGAHVSAPQASLPPIGNSSATPLPAPGGESVSLTKKTCEPLGFALGVPAGFTYEESMAGAVIDGGSAALVISYTYYADRALYGLADFMENEEAVTRSLFKSMEIEQYTPLPGEATTVNGREAYLVECTDMRLGEKEATGMLMLTPMEGDCGCYVLLSLIENAAMDTPVMDKLFACMDSFTVKGPVDTGIAMMEDAKLDFRFLYDENLCAGGTSVQRSNDDTFNCVYLYLDKENKSLCVEMEEAATYAENAEEAMDYIAKVYKNAFSNRERTRKRETMELNGHDFRVEEYTMQVNGKQYGCAFFAVDIGGKTLAGSTIYDEETQDAAITQINTVMSTIEPT